MLTLILRYIMFKTQLESQKELRHIRREIRDARAEKKTQAKSKKEAQVNEQSLVLYY